MTETRVAVHFKDMAVENEVREAVEERCQVITGEFPELHHLDVTITPDGDGFAATVHATGKATEAACHADGGEPGLAADRLLDRLRHQLRRSHDKRIFGRRRDAQRHPPKRNGAGAS